MTGRIVMGLGALAAVGALAAAPGLRVSEAQAGAAASVNQLVDMRTHGREQ